MAGTVEAHDEKDYKFKCPECDACFRVRNTLNGHIRRTHRFEKVVCDVCGISCKSRHEAKVHMRSAHINESRYKCDFCEKRFSTSGSLRIHRRTHTNERPYKCRYEGCDKEYKAGGALVKHVRAVHTNERPFRCQYKACDKAYICSQHLKTHLLWHTQEKPFKCNYCELYFNSTNNRRKHCKRHHPGRPVGRELDNTNTEDDDAVAKFTVKSKINI
ncbi:myoneurin-like [Sabethes cyaneus]|uniref:myoneurin-like n=1 Tax=Sabethes cyaneus TaxID=53552 RepID=UPI00237E65CD|nr:myoneurin-like [Sabethes cyaneus]